MTRTWIIRRSRPGHFAKGRYLGRVDAVDYEQADRLAAKEFPRPFTVEPALPLHDTAPLERAIRRGPTLHHWPLHSTDKPLRRLPTEET